MKRIVLGLLIVSFASATAFAESAKPVPMETRVFDTPRVDGYFVDRCLNWAKQCNGEAAQRFCEMNGYQGFTGWSWGYMKPTRLLGSGQVCNLASPTGCGGITRVICSRVRAAQPPQSTPQGAAQIVPQIEQVLPCQFRPGPNRSRTSHYVCRVSYSLTNTGSAEIVFNYGQSVKPQPWEGGTIQEGIGYPTALLPGRKMMLGGDCIIPHGKTTGYLTLEGRGADPQGRQYPWKLIVQCPSLPQ